MATSGTLQSPFRGQASISHEKRTSGVRCGAWTNLDKAGPFKRWRRSNLTRMQSESVLVVTVGILDARASLMATGTPSPPCPPRPSPKRAPRFCKLEATAFLFRLNTEVHCTVAGAHAALQASAPRRRRQACYIRLRLPPESPRVFGSPPRPPPSMSRLAQGGGELGAGLAGVRAETVPRRALQGRLSLSLGRFPLCRRHVNPF